MNKKPSTQAEQNKEKLVIKRENQLIKKDQQINLLKDEDVQKELKAKGLPVFGTKQERVDRLKKHYGINPSIIQQQDYSNQQQNMNLNMNNNLNQLPQVQQNQQQKEQQQQQQLQPQKIVSQPKSNVVNEIEKLKQKREERRQKMEEIKSERQEKEAENFAQGKFVDIDFDLLIKKNKFQENMLQPHTSSLEHKLCVIVRKRPIFEKDEQMGEIDAISCANPQIRVLNCKYKVDGITKYVDTHNFTFDNAFNQNENSEDVYLYTVKPLIDLLFSQGVVTCFAYGQTGSGKTFTMQGIQHNIIQDLYQYVNQPQYQAQQPKFWLSFYEIYGGRCYDLLNSKNKLNILEDKKNNVQIQGLVEKCANTPQEMQQIIEYGHSVRTTHATTSNDESSRSHAICQIVIKNGEERFMGKLILVDLAGSERAADCQSNNRQRRIEGAEINKSLLALKECIRAMDSNVVHVPFRASKLTLVLRDSFISKSNFSRIVMIACVSPNSSSADHTLNTLRYADRLKDRNNSNNQQQQINNNQLNNNNFNNLNQINNLQYQQNLNQLNNIQAQNNLQFQQKQQQQQHYFPNQQQLQYQQQQQMFEFGEQDDEIQQLKIDPIMKPNLQENLANDHNQINNNDNYPQHNNKPRAQSHQVGQYKPIQNKQNQQQINQPILENDKKKMANINNKNNQVDSESDLEENAILSESPRGKNDKKQVQDDLRCMKETLKLEDPKRVSNEFFDFHDKVNKILEDQEEIFAIHMAVIKEDAKLLTQESELISNAQGINFMDYDIDQHVNKLETLIKKKLKMYNLLNKKLEKFKKHLKEEEEIHYKVKDNLYF